MIKAIFPPFLLILICILFWKEGEVAWEAASLWHPLGTDEFGRDMLSVLCASMLISAFKGVLLSLLATIVGILAGYCMILLESKIASGIVGLLTLVVESIPLLLWIMVMIIVLPIPSIVLILAFSIGTLPFVSRIVAGEIDRLRSQPFFEASRLCGASKLRCTIRHILPNAMPVLAPLAVQLCGAGAAADGVFGLIGLGNRINLDIGTLLLRGKENVLLHPELIIYAILTVALLYFYFWYAFLTFSQKKLDDSTDRILI